MIGLLRFVFASSVWPFTSQARLHATGRDFRPVSEGACSLSKAAWLGRRSPHPTRNSRRSAGRREAHRSHPSKLLTTRLQRRLWLNRTASKRKLGKCAQIIGVPSSIRERG